MMSALDSASTHGKRTDPNIVVIIPAHNEAESVRDVIEKTLRYSAKIIVVDDGSSDATSTICRSLGVKVLRNARQMGKGIALKKGIVEAIKHNPDIVITLDGDGQHNPDDIPKIIEPIQQSEADIVIGSRYYGDSMKELPRRRKFGLKIINRLNVLLTRTHIRDSQSGFRAYGRDVLERVLSYTSTGYGVETEQLALADSYGFRIVEVPITIRYRGLQKTSNKNFLLHGSIIVITIIRILFEKRPLVFFGLSGFALLVAAAITGTHILTIFNETRYFSIPLGIITIGLVLCGGFLILIAFIFYVLARMRIK
jgi:glycosyltransferase involved in cell wall biosynthesis